MRKNREDTADGIPYWDSSYYGKAAGRARVMTTDAIYDWTGTALSGMYKAMRDFRSEGRPESLLEMQEGLVAAYALLAELRARQDARPVMAR